MSRKNKIAALPRCPVWVLRVERFNFKDTLLVCEKEEPQDRLSAGFCECESFQFLTSVKMKLRFAYSNLILGICKSLQSFVPCFEIWEISMSSGKPHFSGEVIGHKKMQWLLS